MRRTRSSNGQAPFVRHLARGALVLGLALAGAPASHHQVEAEPSEPAAESVTLSYQVHRTWGFVLPAPLFTKITDRLPVSLAGHEGFAVERDGEALKLDADGDGAPELTASGDHALVRLRVEAGGVKHMRALRLVKRNDWYFAAGGTWVGEVAGTRLRLIDQNNDGDALDVGEDAMIVGEGEHALFLSNVIAVGTRLFRLQVAAGERAPVVTVTPYEGATGLLSLHAGFETQGRLLSAIVRSQDDTLSFDAAGYAEGLRVPVGTYTLVGGQVGKGESRMAIKGEAVNALEVKADKTTALRWGGPLRAEFSWRRQGEKVLFDPRFVTYFGMGGETYTGFAPAGPSPEFVIREAGDDPTNAKEVARARFGGC